MLTADPVELPPKPQPLNKSEAAMAVDSAARWMVVEVVIRIVDFP